MIDECPVCGRMHDLNPLKNTCMTRIAPAPQPFYVEAPGIASSSVDVKRNDDGTFSLTTRDGYPCDYQSARLTREQYVALIEDMMELL